MVPATFHQIMDKIPHPHHVCYCLFNNIIIYHNGWQWYMQHLGALLRSLRWANPTANP